MYSALSIFLSCFLLGCFSPVSASDTDDPNGLEMKERFIVSDKVIEDWCDAVSDARQEILIAAYKLTSETALQSLLERQSDGVDVRLILDEAASRKPGSLALKARIAGLDVSFWPSEKRGKLHVKLTVIDRRLVIFGSFNLTESAEKTNTELFYQSAQESLVFQALERWESLYRWCTTEKP
jgi:hypothetical protein